MSDTDIIFSSPLIEGIILKRNSQFTMDVMVEDEVVKCHCPTTGRIGELDLPGIPCLLSNSDSANRKTRFTVEAVSLDLPQQEQKTWIGINQNAANRYVEHFLMKRQFPEMVSDYDDIQRERWLGQSKLDFLAGDTYLEVKTPLQNLILDYPPHIKRKKITPFNSTDRFIKHINELANSLENHQRAILLSCFIYSCSSYKVPLNAPNSDYIHEQVKRCIKKGVEIWQVNFTITKFGVSLERYYNTTNNFLDGGSALQGL
ncbi:DNA/RNA nuclease SfsA [Paenibacillus kribbensis]|uniref:DNA/RNA nuclease SfsA n=1 Tax=Paenibacillus kribbensis TaxID=172713 RepID=UPI0008384B5C|nr:DNA/RNA nuclease SfsA [Paenibacillus kribbensis]